MTRRRWSLSFLGAIGMACSDATHRDTDAGCARTVTLAPLQSATLRGEDLQCVALAGDGAAYLIVPQFASTALPFGFYGYRLGAPPTATAGRNVVSTAPSSVPWLVDEPLATRFHRSLRQRERALRRPALGPRALRLEAASVPPVVGSTSDFSVLATLDEPERYARATARLEYVGTHVLVYVDVAAPERFTSAQLTALGAQLDGPLYEANHTAFGDESDLDDNGRVVVLVTPVVNALVDQISCARSGFVNGFFWGHDLVGSAPTANGGEVVYLLAPDPRGEKSCPHTVDEVLDLVPVTFIHELQHLISFGEHVVKRGDTAEELWLNEGLSHLAEELGSLVYEHRYPPPAGRTDPTQAFPDSAWPFIRTDLRSASWFLESSGSYSVTTPDPLGFGAFEERAAAWLFLRWLIDLKGEGILRRLVPTPLTGAANIEAAAGESLTNLLGDFSLALFVDSLPGESRGAIQARQRFRSRNLRALFVWLHTASSGLYRPFPIVLDTIRSGDAVARSMRPGTMRFHYVGTKAGDRSLTLSLLTPDGQAMPAAYGAQLGIVRLRAP